MAMASNSSGNCNLCRKEVNDVLNYGDIMTKSNLSVHYFCILLSTNLMQRGSDKAGFLGFQINDVKREIKSASKRKCCYCKENYASIKCKSCLVYFHLKCGLDNKCNFEFIDKFQSSCHEHNEYLKIKSESNYNSKMSCPLCYVVLGEFDVMEVILPECCRLAWVHRKCLQLYSLSSGYYCSCILCKAPNFRNAIRYQGIFVPDRDAAWELDKVYFANLYKRYSKCDSTPCHLIGPKSYFKKNLLLCNCCAASGIHKICFLKTYNYVTKEYTCPECMKIFNATINSNSLFTCRTLVSSHLEINCDLEKSINRDETLYLKKNSISDFQEKPDQINKTTSHGKDGFLEIDHETNAISFNINKNLKITFDPEKIQNCNDKKLDIEVLEDVTLKYFQEKERLLLARKKSLGNQMRTRKKQ